MLRRASAPRSVFASCVFLAAIAGAIAQSSTVTNEAGAFRGEPFTSTAAELRAASALVPVDPEFDDQILLEEGTYRIATDGTLTYQYRLIFRVDGKDGIEGWSEFSANWDPWYEKPAQLNARVLQADGKFVELDQKTVTDAPIKGDDEVTYSSEHVRRAPLPGVAVGSIVEEVHVVEEKIPYFAAGALYRYRFQESVPMARVRAVVDMPATMPFQDHLRNLADASVTRETSADGRRHIVYEKTSEPAWHASDIDLSTNAPEGPMLEFATGASWKALAAAYAAVSDPQTVPADAAPIMPENLPEGRRERIDAIVSRLHHEVRYTGVEFGSARLVPQRPSEVIHRHYGDCKDKATLLVAMLREAKIPAYLAVLSTGPGMDVTEDLPGMTQFDHVIVYVPADGKEEAIWIDATAEYFVPGSLPYDDEGRMALIISPETTHLTRTPEMKAQDSQLVETRTFKLAEHGPSHVVEVSHTSGDLDATFRSMYGGTDTKKIHADLEQYARNSYLAKTLTKMSHGNVDDLSKPFDLTLEIDGAARGTTALDEAEVVVFPNMVLASLPKWFGTQPEVVGPDTTAEKKQALKLAASSRLSSYVFRPYTDERDIRIAIPDGYQLRSLPPKKTTKIGIGTLTEEYSAAEPGLVTATFKFDSGDGKLTAAQALEMRDAVLELNKREYVGISFDQVGSKALAEGHIRIALDTDRSLIAKHPSEAMPHVQLARALLAAGIGDQAHAEAKRATELDPKSAVAFNTLGWTLEHDSLGTRFGSGFDRRDAVAAYEKSISLDADDNDVRFDLAILYEFNSRGIRYAPDADLEKAAATYRDLIERTKDSNNTNVAQYKDNLAYLLLFQHKYADLDAMLAKMPFSNAHAALEIASATAQHDTAAGIAQSAKGNVAGQDRDKNLLTAGSLLAQLQLYPQASVILQAGIGGGDDAPATARQIEMYKNLKPVSLEPLPAANPARPVEQLSVWAMAGTLTGKDADHLLAHEAYSSDATRQFDVEKNLTFTGFLRALATSSGMSQTVLLDLIAGNMTFTSSGDDEGGYIVTEKPAGAEESHYFVVKEDGEFRIVADEHDLAPVGNAVIYALDHKNLKLAKSLLDWKRDLTHKAGGDDEFAGLLLPRFWTVGSSKPGADSPEAMRFAAISLIAGSMDGKPYVAEVAAAREKAIGSRQVDLDLLLAFLASGAEEPAVALQAAKRLLEEDPDSLTVLQLAGQSYAQMNDAKSWLAMLEPRLAKKPKDHDLLSEQVRAYEAANDFAKARESAQAVLDSGKATSNDYNSYAWLGLFDNHTGEAELKAAQQSNMMSKNANFADLHTMACVYAAQGRTTEARQVLAQAMAAGNESTPNSEVWYALGMIYEQYGATDAALAAYSKVEAHPMDNHTYVDPMSTYLLAQARIKALAANKAQSS